MPIKRYDFNVGFADLTGVGAVGTYATVKLLKAGALVLAVRVEVTALWKGDTSAAIAIGTVAAPTRFSGATAVDGFTALGKFYAAPAVWPADPLVIADVAIQIRVTSALAYASVNSGAAAIQITYADLNVKPIGGNAGEVG
jgi:hypothetical protein